MSASVPIVAVGATISAAVIFEANVALFATWSAPVTFVVPAIVAPLVVRAPESVVAPETVREVADAAASEESAVAVICGAEMVVAAEMSPDDVMAGEVSVDVAAIFGAEIDVAATVAAVMFVASTVGAENADAVRFAMEEFPVAMRAPATETPERKVAVDATSISSIALSRPPIVVAPVVLRVVASSAAIVAEGAVMALVLDMTPETVTGVFMESDEAAPVSLDVPPTKIVPDVTRESVAFAARPMPTLGRRRTEAAVISRPPSAAMSSVAVVAGTVAPVRTIGATMPPSNLAAVATLSGVEVPAMDVAASVPEIVAPAKVGAAVARKSWPACGSVAVELMCSSIAECV